MTMIFPNIIRDLDRDSLANHIYGLRIHEDQTLYEYLLEFLLIFISQKGVGTHKGFNNAFPDLDLIQDSTDRLQYFALNRMGLKRFVFFERSKNENKYQVDKEAYNEICNLIEKKINIESDNFDRSEVLNVMQDLFYGFNAIIRNRSWFVQSLLPICPEVIFSETMGRNKDRVNLKFKIDSKDVDYKFEINGHYFLARSGEVYFLHILQGLIQTPEKQLQLEIGIRNLLSSFPQFSHLSNWIQHQWEKYVFFEQTPIVKTCEWIPAGYERRASYTVNELLIFLQSNIDPFQKTEILATGVILQVLRMMHEQAHFELNGNDSPPVWIVDLKGNQYGEIRKRSIISYNSCEDDLLAVLYTKLDVLSDKKKAGKSDVKLISEATESSHKLFRKMGKEIELVIPPKGGGMRFSLSENLVKFLVLSIIPPNKKVSLTTFLKEIYKHYYIIIGPQEMLECSFQNRETELNISDFEYNKNAFQELLKKCGFLRDLSDSTSIVENPFGRIK